MSNDVVLQIKTDTGWSTIYRYAADIESETLEEAYQIGELDATEPNAGTAYVGFGTYRFALLDIDTEVLDASPEVGFNEIPAEDLVRSLPSSSDGDVIAYEILHLDSKFYRYSVVLKNGMQVSIEDAVDEDFRPAEGYALYTEDVQEFAETVHDVKRFLGWWAAIPSD